MPLKTVAQRINCSSTYICQIEKGKATPSSAEFLDKLAKALDLTDEECVRLKYAAAASRSSVEIDENSSERVYYLVHQFARKAARLEGRALEMVEMILELY